MDGVNMKKTLKILTSILIVLWILIGAYFLYDKYRKKDLAGVKITEGIYLYKLDIGNEYHSVRVYEDNIYYWTAAGSNYDFYKVGIYDNKNVKIGNSNIEESYCYFEDNYINCSTIDKMILYNFKFKKLYEGDIKTVIPYKKKLIKFENNTVYYNDKEFKKIKVDLTNYNFYRHEIFDDNMYLFFSRHEDYEPCLLNVKSNKCEDYTYTNVKRYNDGLYFIDKEKIRILDANTNSIKDIRAMFEECKNLEYLNIKNWDTRGTQNVENIFRFFQ